jgi:5-methylcytosine-specific restriction enzyme A
MPYKALTNYQKDKNTLSQNNGGLYGTLPQRNSAEHRPHAAQRGYDALWRKLRVIYLREHPLCVHCQQHGMIVAATEVDHIIAKRNGGSNDDDNLQALCKSCHSKKTAKERVARIV